MTHSPDQIWWTAREIAEAGLPDMAGSQRGVDMIAKREHWRTQKEFARRRSGRGGGWEYHWKLFPLNAQKSLLATTEVRKPARPVARRDDAWRWYEGLPDRDKEKAAQRLAIIQAVEALESGGCGRDLAVSEIAKFNGVTGRTIWNWLGMVEGVRTDDRLPYLAPRHRAAKSVAKKECSPEFWEFLKGDYLRLEQPSFTTCYRRAVRVAQEQGWDILPERTMRRRMQSDVSRTTITLCRKGVDALKAMYPAQTRDKAALHAMEAVNADYHRFDVFVKWPVEGGADGEFDIVRPQMVAFQDIYSGRILSWRIDRTPNKVGVSLALGDMIEEYGIPDHLLLDNGREFANKFLTGQVPTRFRFKVKEDDIPGILKSLGVEVHWATPYAAQSKPIERAFRDLCDSVAKDPRLAGAYTGNRPEAKPENYGSKAIDLEDFLAVVADGIEEHNTRQGRRSASANGRSLAETFDASYVRAPIRKATEEQRRLWLMGAEGVTVDRNTAVVKFMGNEYWSAWMHDIAGQKVVARFDPADFTTGLHIYRLDGAYAGLAECKVASGFFDLEEARNHSSARSKWLKAERAAAEAARRMKITDISDHLDATRQAPSQPKEAHVVRPVFNKKPQPVAAPEFTEAEQETHAAMIANFEAAKSEKPEKEPDYQAYERFQNALKIEAKLRNGGEVNRDDRRRVEHYKTSAEYKGLRLMYDQFGDKMFG